MIESLWEKFDLVVKTYPEAIKSIAERVARLEEVARLKELEDSDD